MYETIKEIKGDKGFYGIVSKGSIMCHICADEVSYQKGKYGTKIIVFKLNNEIVSIVYREDIQYIVRSEHGENKKVFNFEEE